MNPHLPDVEAVYAEETNRVTAERLPIMALVFALVIGLAWLVEHSAHPERTVYFALVYGGELLTLGIATLLSRQAGWRQHCNALAVGTTVTLAAWIGLYYVLTGGDGEVLALALLYLVTGAMVLMPWGWQGQLPVAISALLTYGIAVALGVRVVTLLPVNFLGLGAITALSVAGAAFQARHRIAMLRQAGELRATNAALAEANQAKNQFLAGVSHELRTPLNIIVGYTDLLLEGHFGALPAEAGDVLERVARNSRSLVYLISDLLDLSRMEAGQLLIHLAPVDLASVFSDMAQFVEARIGASKDVTFHATHPGTLRVVADRDRLEQILVNLLSNATKFTSRGEIHLSTQRATEGIVDIEVRDTGMGIDDAELPNLFEPFSQGEIGKRLGGVGIGLSLSLRLAQAMGGMLSVSSEVGRGSTFILRLPVAAG